MTDFDEYCQRYLRQWEERATVRHFPRTRLTVADVDRELYPPAMSFVLRHPEVAALGADARRRLLARNVADFMHYVTLAEVDIVVAACGRLAKDGLGRVPTPDSTRQVALTVATDEAYHSFVAREFLVDLERHTGVVPAVSVEHIFADIVRQAPADLSHETDIMLLCFAENMLTEEIMGLSKEADPQGIFHTVMREHMRDEGRHQLFFQNLFRFLWREIDEDGRVHLGRLIPVYLEAIFSSSSKGFMERLIAPLVWLGFDAPAAERIAAEALTIEFGTTPPPPKHKMQFIKNSFHLLAEAHVLEHAPTLQAMVETGWADA